MPMGDWLAIHNVTFSETTLHIKVCWKYDHQTTAVFYSEDFKDAFTPSRICLVSPQREKKDSIALCHIHTHTQDQD